VLLVVFGASVTTTLRSGPLVRPAPPVLAVGDAFQGSPELPKERIDAALNDARARVALDNTTGNRFHLAARIMSWASFLLTAVIALVAGAFGPTPSPGAAPDAATLKLIAATSKRWARTIGLLAAAAAVLTAASGRTDTEATQAYASADGIQREALIARKGVLDARDADEATTVLDDLSMKVTRH
jgi:hypothetical protein